VSASIVTRVLRSAVLLAIAALAMDVLQPPAQADSLDAILARMDGAAKDFKTVTTDLKQVTYTKVIKDFSEQTGVLRMKRDKKGLRAITEYTKPDVRAVFFKNKTVSSYYPKAKQVQVIDLGKYTTLVDQFLLLAFGTSGADLRKNYEIKPVGAETIGTTATTRLELTPIAPDAKKYIAKIELWMKDGESYAIREKVTETSGDYNLADYTNIKVNGPLSDADVELKLPPGVTFVKPH
jgi:outer membrane lipoprotein-sorting protein